MSWAYLYSRIVQHVQQGSKKKDGFSSVDIFLMSHTHAFYCVRCYLVIFLPLSHYWPIGLLRSLIPLSHCLASLRQGHSAILSPRKFFQALSTSVIATLQYDALVSKLILFHMLPGQKQKKDYLRSNWHPKGIPDAWMSEPTSKRMKSFWKWNLRRWKKLWS